MAAIRWYLRNAVDANGWQELTETAQGAATLTAGWVVGTGTTNSSEHQSGAATDRASSTFTGNTVPDGSLDTSLKDAFRTDLLNGSFASANWSFQFAVVSTIQAGAADGAIVFRMIKADADGSNPTEIAAGQHTASTATNVGGTDVNSTLTFNPGAFTITGQYLFIQVAWKRTGAGGMTTTNIRLRTGSAATPTGTSILSSDFTLAVTGGTISAGSAANAPTTVAPDQALTGGTVASTAALTEPTAAQTVVVGGTTLADSYDPSNQSGSWTAILQDEFAGQVFTGNGEVLAGATVWMRRGITTTGTLVAQLYATTGTPGSTAVPTGSVLATSDSVDVATNLVVLSPLTGNTLTRGSPVTFSFSGSNRVTLGNGTAYALVITPTSLSGASVPVFADSSSSTHAGNHVFKFTAGDWQTNAWDVVFHVWTKPADQLFAPTVAVEDAGQNVTGDTIPSTATLTAPEVAHVVTQTTIASTLTVSQPTVAYEVANGTIASTLALTQPDVRHVVELGTVTSTTTLTAPSLTHVAEGATIASTAALTAPTLAHVLALPTLGGVAYSSTFIGAEGPLSEGGLWTGGPGAWDAPSKSDGALATGANQAARLESTPGISEAQYSQITYDQDPGSAGLSWVGVITRIAAGAGGCLLAIAYDDEVRFYRTDDDGSLTFVLLDSVAANLGAAPRSLRLESSGSTHRVYHNGALVLEQSASEYSTGQPGIAASMFGGPQVKITAFEGGELRGATVFTPTISAGALAVGLSTIASTATLTVPTVVPGEVTVTGGTVASTAALTAPEVRLVTELGTIASGATLTAPTLAHVVDLATVASGSTLTAPAVAHVVELATLASTTTLTAPALAHLVELAHLAAGSAATQPSVANVVELATLASTTTLTAPTVVPGEVTVTGGTVTSGSTLTAPDVVLEGGVALPTLTSGVVAFAPTVTAGPVTVDVPALASGATAFAPTVAAVVDLGTAASTATTFAPTVEAGAVTVDLPTLASGTTVTAPTITTVTTVDLPILASGTVVFAPTVEVGAVTVDLPTLASGTTLTAPTVTTLTVIELATLASGATVTAPSVEIGPALLELPTLAAGATVTAPTIALFGVQTLGLPTLAAGTVVRTPVIAHMTGLSIVATIPSGGGIVVVSIPAGGGLALSTPLGGGLVHVGVDE